MPHTRRQSKQRPRELRRRVVMPARLRSISGWTDACILNISSRGLLIHSARTGPEGSKVELWRGEHVIVARVVWQDGSRAGLQAEDRLPVDEILSLNAATGLILTAADHSPSNAPPRERRRKDRRSQGRAIEFVGVVVIACSLAATAYDMVEQAFARPMAMVEQALGG
jgi:hypothetical protein